LYHWPFGGWRSRYKGLAALYRQDPDAAVARFQRAKLPRQTASAIRL
jgi:hypothetical protein